MLTKQLLLVVLLAFAGVRLTAQTQSPKGRPPAAGCDQRSPGKIVCTIDKPAVDQRLTAYPSVTFHEGQVVSIEADGYVNTDTRGEHWVHYVNPCGYLHADLDRLYHGLIWIPGATSMDGKAVPVGSAPVPLRSVSRYQSCRSKLPWQRPSKFETLTFRISHDSTLRIGYEGGENKDQEYTPNPNNNYEHYGYTVHGDKTKEGCGGERQHPCAKVVVTISDATTAPTTREADVAKPFDVKSEAIDVNGFLLSPQWEGVFDLSTIGGPGHDNASEQASSTDECGGFQYRNPWLAIGPFPDECTRQVSFDTPQHLINACLLEPALGRLHGHVNWAPATYFGKLVLHAQANSSSGKISSTSLETYSLDGDIDLHLAEFSADEYWSRFGSFTPGAPAAASQRSGAGSDTNANSEAEVSSRAQHRIEPILTQESQNDSEYRHVLQLEFSQRELLAIGSDSSAWGSLFKYSPTKSEQKSAMVYVSSLEGRTAVANGLLNLDCVHDCHTELHPVFAIAVRRALESDERFAQSDFVDEWILFARERGDEGSCAQEVHFLDRDSFSFYLPRPVNGPSEINPDITAELKSNTDGLQWTAVPKPGGVLLEVTLKHNEHAPIGLSGAVKISWKKAKQHSHSYEGPVERVPIDPKSKVKNPATIWGTLTNYFRPDIGPSEERLWVHNASPWLTGVQGDLVGTALGSLHAEVAWARPSSATSARGFDYVTHATLWLVGMDLGLGGLRSWPNLFLELTGGKINKSADPKLPTSPPFEHFHGKDSVFSYGLGYTFHPLKNPWFSVRTFIGDLYVPGTNDHLFRLSVSPQMRLPRKGQ